MVLKNMQPYHHERDKNADESTGNDIRGKMAVVCDTRYATPSRPCDQNRVWRQAHKVKLMPSKSPFEVKLMQTYGHVYYNTGLLLLVYYNTILYNETEYL